MAETAVRKWLSRRYGKVIATSGFPDFVCADPDSNKTMGFEVKYLSSGKVRLDHLESVFNVEAMLNNKLIKKMDVMTLVIVMPTMEELRE
jgi:hypothetical protein